MHGGMSLPISRKYNITQINNYMRHYLIGNIKIFYTNLFKELFILPSSLLWNRDFSKDNPNCQLAQKVLDNQKASYMVLGHTPQKGINLKCGTI